MRRGVLFVALSALVLACMSCSGSSQVLGGPSAKGRAALHALLMQAPRGSQPWTTSWGQTVFPTVDQYLDEIWLSSFRQQIRHDLTVEGLTGITHITWVARDGDQGDVVLMSFSSPAGAKKQYDDLVSHEVGEGVEPVSISASHAVSMYIETALDQYAHIHSVAFSYSGTVGMELFGFSKNSFDATTIEGWVRQQISRLPG